MKTLKLMLILAITAMALGCGADGPNPELITWNPDQFSTLDYVDSQVRCCVHPEGDEQLYCLYPSDTPASGFTELRTIHFDAEGNGYSGANDLKEVCPEICNPGSAGGAKCEKFPIIGPDGTIVPPRLEVVECPGVAAGKTLIGEPWPEDRLCYWDTELEFTCAFDSPLNVADPDLCLPLMCAGDPDSPNLKCQMAGCVPPETTYEDCDKTLFAVYYAGPFEGGVILTAPQYGYCEGKVYSDFFIPAEGSEPGCPVLGTCNALGTVCQGTGTERPDLTFADRTDQEQAAPLAN